MRGTVTSPGYVFHASYKLPLFIEYHAVYYMHCILCIMFNILSIDCFFQKVKRVDTNLKVKVKKVLTKSELEIQLKSLLEINDTLEETNSKNMKVIASFGEKIQSLEAQIRSLEKYSEKEVLISQQTQTETDLNLKCDECNFEGANERELGWQRKTMGGQVNGNQRIWILVTLKGLHIVKYVTMKQKTCVIWTLIQYDA